MCWLQKWGTVGQVIVINPYAAAGFKFGQYKMMQKTWKMTETLANGYSSESTRRELSNEYQHDRVLMIFTNICIFVLWKKVASALEGLTGNRRHLSFPIT